MMIVAAEPICCGGEHAVLNAGLLATIRLGFPESPLLFLAEQEHLREVRQVLAREDIHDLETFPICPSNRNCSPVMSIPSQYRVCRKILRTAYENGSTKVIVCAVNAVQLLCLKLLLRTVFTGTTVVAITHGALQGIMAPPPRRPWNSLIRFRNALRWGNLGRLKIVVPGESILQVMLKELPDLAEYAHSLRLAYFFPDSPAQCESEPAKVAHFGFIGVGTLRKGIDTFFELAYQIHEEADSSCLRPEFIVAGPVTVKSIREEARRCVSYTASGRFLSPDEIADLVKPLHYAVFPYRKEDYQLVASAAFLDALAHLKPVIALRNPYFEHYFQRMGDIGYLCDSYEDMVSTVRGILSEFPTDRYRQQVENIRKGRVIFEPDTLAPRLRNIMESCED